MKVSFPLKLLPLINDGNNHSITVRSETRQILFIFLYAKVGIYIDGKRRAFIRKLSLSFPSNQK